MPYLKKLAPDPEPIDCRVLTAALDLFVEKGYHSVSIHEVQKISDVSIGSIYKHFGGKEGIAKKLYLHVLNELDELIVSVTEKLDDPVDQIEEIIKQLFEHTETHEYIISFLFYTKHTDFLPGEPLMNNSEPFLKIKEITSKATQSKNNTINIDIADALVLGSAIRMIQLRIDGVIDDPLVNHLESLMNNVWNGLKT